MFIEVYVHPKIHLIKKKKKKIQLAYMYLWLGTRHLAELRNNFYQYKVQSLETVAFRHMRLQYYFF